MGKFRMPYMLASGFNASRGKNDRAASTLAVDPVFALA